MMGASTLVPGLPICSVYPSGLERAISSIARMPKAPGLFSITIGWPRIGRICSPTMRMTISVALPGPNGTTTLMGFEGYLSCAEAGMPYAKTSNNRTIRRFMSVDTRGAEVTPPVLIGQFDLDLGDRLSPRGKLVIEPRLRLFQ